MNFYSDYERILEVCLKEKALNPFNKIASNILYSWHGKWNAKEICPYVPDEYKNNKCRVWWFVELDNNSKVIPHTHPLASKVFIMCLSGSFDLIIHNPQSKKEACRIAFKPGNYMTIAPDCLHSAKGNSFILTCNFS